MTRRALTPRRAVRRRFSAERHPESTALALDRLVEVASLSPDPSWALPWAERERAGLVRRSGDRWLWGTTPDRPEALVWVDRFPGVGSSVGVFLLRTHPASNQLREIVSYFDHVRRGGPVVRFSEWVPAVPPRTVHKALASFGFQWVSRVDYRFPAGDPVPAPPEVGFARIRTARASDAGVLAELHARAYSDDPVESTLFRERPDRLTDARHAIRGILGTGLGEWWPRASFVAERSGAALGATLVNGFHGPLITEVLVHPDYRRRGLATHLLARSVEAIRERTSDVPRLVVTETNQRAVALYQGFGFKVDLSSRGRVGLRRSLIHT